MYLSHKKVHMFPVAIDRPNHPSSRILSEDNIRNLVKSMSENTSFVVTQKYDSKSDFEFVVDGYYIKLHGTTADELSFSGKDVYAVIVVQGVDSECPLLWGYEDDDKFTGVSFVEDINNIDVSAFKDLDSYKIYYLHILSKDESGSYYIPDSSKARFTGTSLGVVDGGEIE